MKNWKNWILVLLFLLLVGGFWLIWEKYPKEVVKVEVRENEKKIDSLEFVVKEKSSVIDSLKKQKEKVIEKVVVKVEKIKDLPPDSTIKLFYGNLQNYGEIESTEVIGFVYGNETDNPEILERYIGKLKADFTL